MDSSREAPARSLAPAPSMAPTRSGDPGDPPRTEGAAREAVVLSWLEVLIADGLLPGKPARRRLRRPF
jgi:hypothetical protein